MVWSSIHRWMSCGLIEWFELHLDVLPHKEYIIPELLQHLVLLSTLGNQREVRHIHFKEDGLRLDLLNLKSKIVPEDCALMTEVTPRPLVLQSRCLQLRGAHMVHGN